jgi:F-type H+-transporting ATPase subunit b
VARTFLRRAAALSLAVTPALAAAEGGEAAGAGGGNALITPQIGLIFWTLVTFLALLWGLKRYAWGPIIAAMTAREEGIRGDLSRARTEREEAQRLLEEHRALLVQARKERAEAVEAGRQDAERLKAGILDDARKQREQLVKSADTQIQAGLRQAKAELKGTAVDLAIQAAAKLLGKNLDDQTQRRLVEDYIADLERLGTGGHPN